MLCNRMAAIRRVVRSNCLRSVISNRLQWSCTRFLCQPVANAELARDERIEDRRLHVKSINFATTRDSIEKYFSSFGEVEDLKYPMTRLTNRGQGYAFVLFKDKSALDLVLKSTHVLQGRTLSVQKALPRLKQAGNPKTAHVKNISPNTPKEQIVQHFSKFGKVVRVDLPLDTKNMQRLNYCFVHFSSPEELDAAIQENKQTLNSQPVEVQRSMSKAFVESTNKIVGYPPVTTTVEATKQLFSQFGAIQSIAMKFCFVSMDAPPRPVSIVTFKEERSAEEAANKEDLMVDGAQVVVYKASPHAWPISAYHRKLFIEELPSGVTEAQLTQAFEYFGSVRGVIIVKNPETGELLDWCVVTFKQDGAVDKALQQEKHYVQGKEVKVRRCGWNAPSSAVVEGLLFEESTEN